MHTGLDALTDREKETLRLLLAGHDAKSIARSLDLSVHTVNERLRDARRKLGVSSSREAARLLAGVEEGAPKFLRDSQIGVAATLHDMVGSGQPDRRDRVGRLSWLAGGMLIMSLIIAAAVLAGTIGSGTGSQQGAAASSGVTPADRPDAAGVEAATAWAVLLDQQRWEDSWTAASTLFKSKITAVQWAATITPVRQPLGVPPTRKVLTVNRSATLPGAPAGDYQIVQIQAAFPKKQNAVETVVLARENAVWKVAGYFIR